MSNKRNAAEDLDFSLSLGRSDPGELLDVAYEIAPWWISEAERLKAENNRLKSIVDALPALAEAQAQKLQELTAEIKHLKTLLDYQAYAGSNDY